MKELTMSGDRRMTVREVAEALGCTPAAVKRHIRELFPDLMKSGVVTHLTETQITMILEKMKQGQAYAHHVLGGDVTTYNSGITGTNTSQSLYLQTALKERELKELWKQIAEQERQRAEQAEGRAGVAEAERDYERTEHNSTKKVLAFQVAGNKHHQDMLEALGAVRTDREDMLETYRREKHP